MNWICELDHAVIEHLNSVCTRSAADVSFSGYLFFYAARVVLYFPSSFLLFMYISPLIVGKVPQRYGTSVLSRPEGIFLSTGTSFCTILVDICVVLYAADVPTVFWDASHITCYSLS